MSAILSNVCSLFSSDSLEDPYPLYAAMRVLGPVCQLGSTRAFFVGTHAAASEVVMRHEDFSANRDPRQWPDPDKLLLDRPGAARHLGFGYGIHFCIGAPLARLEARVAVEELLARSSLIRLDAARPPQHVPSLFVRRLQHLHLRLA